MKKKYIIIGILVFLFSAISIYLVLDTDKETYAVGEGDVIEGENANPSTGGITCLKNDGSISTTPYVYTGEANITITPNSNVIIGGQTEFTANNNSSNYITIKYYNWSTTTTSIIDVRKKNTAEPNKALVTGIANGNGTINLNVTFSPKNQTDVDCQKTVTKTVTVRYPKVTYDCGSNTINECPSISNGTSSGVSITSSTPQKYNYKFKGWNTRENGTGTNYNSGTTYTTITQDITLYAQWEEYSQCTNAIFSITPTTSSVAVGSSVTYTAAQTNAATNPITNVIYLWGAKNGGYFSVTNNTSTPTTTTLKGLKSGTDKLQLVLNYNPKGSVIKCQKTVEKDITIKPNGTPAPTCSDAYIDGYEKYVTVPNVNKYTLKSDNSKISFSNITWTIPNTLGFYGTTTSCKNQTECQLKAITASNQPQTITVKATLTMNGKSTTCDSITKTIAKIKPQPSNAVNATCSNTTVKITGPHIRVTEGITNSWYFELVDTEATTEPQITASSWSITPFNSGLDTKRTEDGVFYFQAGIGANNTATRTITGKYKVNGTECSTALTTSFAVREPAASTNPLTCDDFSNVAIKATKTTVDVGTKVTYTIEGATSDITFGNWQIEGQEANDVVNSTSSKLELTPMSAGTRRVKLTYSVNGSSCGTLTKKLTVNIPVDNTPEENCDTTEVKISGPITLIVGTNAKYELIADSDGAILSDVSWSFPQNFTIINGSQQLSKVVVATEVGEKTITARYSVNGSSCSNPATLEVTASYEEANESGSESGNTNDVTNPQTGSLPVYIAFAIGLGMLGYSYYYTKKLKEN